MSDMACFKIEGHAGDWQPIETAPKTGAQIILYFPKPDWVCACSWARPRGTVYAENWCVDGEWFPYNPTHWMPMPEPPVEPLDNH